MSMFDSYPKQFGPYNLLEKIGQGGMAEIFRAESLGARGFAKEVAIKRILPSLAHNDDFITQFLDEARIAGSLSHANIVQIYDVGQVGDDYYIAMEYIKGKHLGQVIRQTIENMRYFPSNIAACVINEVAKALSFAHSAHDTLGQPLNIIHRDISPQNILIAINGSVKLTDFGIAKAANRLYQTTAGVIKGKFSYLAPEQLTGAPASPRSDLFALGIVFWELLAGRRLFQANSDIQTIQLVQACKIPPLSQIRNDVPEDLEQIVRKVLSADPEHRYQQTSELTYDLTQYLSRQGQTEALSTVANFMGGLYPEEAMQPSGATPATATDMPAMSMDALRGYGEDATTQRHQFEAESTQILEQPDLSINDSSINSAHYLGTEESIADKTLTFESSLATKSTSKIPAQSRSRSLLVFFFLLLLLGGLGGGTAFVLTKGIQQTPYTPQPIEKAALELILDPPATQIVLNGVSLKGEGKTRVISNLVGGIRYQIQASCEGYQTQKRTVIAKDGNTYSLQIKLKKAPPKALPEPPPKRPKRRRRRRKRRRKR